MTPEQQRAALDALTERDKKILSCARRAVNALGFALQNAHNENAVCRREQESDAAMNELTDLLLSNPAGETVIGFAPDAARIVNKSISEMFNPVTSDEVTHDERCPICNGSGQIDDGFACNRCGLE